MKTITLKCQKNVIFLIGFFACSIIGYSQTTQVYNSSGTFIVPAGVTSVQVEAWGAGGAGGGNTTNIDGSGAGGGGAYSKVTGTVTSGTTYPVTVGVGGVGSTGDGADGGDSSFGSGTAINALGGNGGKAPIGGLGGVYGSGGSGPLSTGSTKYSGGNGGSGRNGGGAQGGPGGSSGGTTANGNSGAITWSTVTAAGAPAGGGKGGNGGNGNANGNPGVIPGGGGGGAGKGIATVGGNGANGRVTITLTCPTYALTAATTATGPFCGTTSSTVTIKSSSMPSGTYTVTYNLTGATGLIGNTATVTFTAGSPGTGTFTTPGLNAGTTNITITNIASGTGCSNAVGTNNTASVFEVVAPTVNSGTAITTCSTSGAINITAGATASNYTFVEWTSSGTGTFVNPFNLTTCTYNPSAADIAAGNVTLTLTANATAPCSAITSTKVLTINSAPTAIAGAAMSVCYSGSPINITAGSSATNYATILWTSSGTGTFSNASSLTTCTYTPSAADLSAGNVTLTLTAANPGCSNATSTKVLTLSNTSTAVAGPAMTTCSAGAVNVTPGSSATNYTSVTWTSSGTGTFANANSLTTCTYTPSAADITAGSVILTLTANASCGSAADTKTLTIGQAPTAIAGTAIATCYGAGAVNITAGSSASNYTSVTWTSSGSGTFTNANSLTTCTYNPSLADKTAGSVTLTLTATSAACGNVTSTKTLTISSSPTAVAGAAMVTCSNSGAINITTGSSATNYASVTWTSSGTGTFTNATSLTTCTYNPSAADIAAGSVTLTLTANATAPCTNAADTKILTINPAPVAVAGTAIATCYGAGAINITAGSSASNYTSVTWTSSGTGTFTNANSLTTCTYNPSLADKTAGSVTLTLTATNTGCANAVSTKVLTISSAPTAVAGAAMTTCSNSGAINITAGSSATNYSAVTWTSSGTGTFANANSLTTCTYTPSAADIAAGSVTLTLTAIASAPCSNATATKILTISQAPNAIAGTAIITCYGAGAVNITAGSSATNYTSVTWTSSGTGTFTNPNSLTTCTYNPSLADKTAGSVTLTLTAANTGCSNAVSTKVLTVVTPATAVAGTAVSGCSNAAINITAGSSATNYVTVTWTSSGTGTFADANSLTICTYTPSAADTAAGSVTLTLTATANTGCSAAVSTKTLTINLSPTAVAGSGLTTCSSSGAINITAGSSATNATSVLWTSSGTGTFTNATSLTTCTYNPSAADKTAGSVILTLTATNAACGSDSSTKTLVIYSVPSITGTTPGTRVGPGTVILGASASSGTINWYAAATGGASLGFGSTFTTPVISVTTTYYVEATNGSCSTPTRTAVIASVIYPEIDIKGNATTIVDGDTTPSTADWTDFGSTNLTRTFTIYNTGAGTLSLGTVTISGANASDFTVTTVPSTNVSTGQTTTFTLTFNPTAVGVRTATVSISNNDADENPYDFSIQGTGVDREIDIQGNAVTIVDGDTTPSTGDWTDFGSVTATQTFTIRNLGNIVLNVGAITITGLNASDFAVTTPPSATVAAYGTTTFVVTFTPSAINNRVATLNIANNDSNENPYDFAIQGFGIIPEMDVRGNAVSIVDGDTTPSTSDWTNFGSATVTRTYTIFNQGNTNLTIGAITFTGTNASEFTVTTPPSATVGAFGSTTFVVSFAPTATGVRTATINIVNNDSNENPYDFAIQGTGVDREIDIRGNAVSIVDGDTTPATSDWTDFSNVALTRVFTIYNSGNIPLTLGAITFTGTNASEFSVTTPPVSPVPAFSNTTFTVTFAPGAVGTRTATINIVNSDANENPYDFALQGTGGIPEINIKSQYNVNIVDGDTTPSSTDQTDFGNVSMDGGSVTINLIIENTGSGALSIGAGTFSGANASNFAITTAPATTVAAGGNSRFKITFTPTTIGVKTATFSLVNGDSDENPYDFALTGLGVQTYKDTDGDGVTDNKDIDDDNDGIVDLKEQTDGLTYPLTSLVQYTFLNETFGAGTTKGTININTPGATCTYCYEDGYGSPCDATRTLEDGEYVVTYKITGAVSSDPENIHGDLAWYDGLDHTPADTNGRMAVFNASYAAGTFYETRIDGVIPNVPISYSFWVLNIMRQGNFPGSILPNITVEFLDLSNNLISSYNTGNIGRCTTASATDNSCALSNWLQYSTSVNLGNQTSFIVRFKNNSTGGGGNDLAIDDINITQNYIDTDGDGIANIFDLDDENDGIADVEEAGFKAYSNGLSKMDLSSPTTWTDANANGLNDVVDAQISGGSYLIADTDGDGVPNYLDLDSDNDSAFDVDEAGLLNGDGDINGDGRGDLADTDKDGILDLYDNNTGFGTTTRIFAQDTDSNGIADYLQLDSNNDGTSDIAAGLYASLDANSDGKIDGSADVDKDGILDAFDTNTSVIGSPRDLDRKLFLDFDGRNDYGQENASILGGLSSGALMAWIDLNSAFSGDGVIIGQDKFQLRVTSSKTIEAVVNTTVVNFATPLATQRWYHVAVVYTGSLVKLYLNGLMVNSASLSGAISADASLLTIGKNPLSNTQYFKGKIDEARIFNSSLTDDQLHKMVYQEIKNNSSQVRGEIVPKDVGSLPYANLLRYYRMDAYKDDIIDNYTTASIDVGSGMRIYNNKYIAVQQAPMPFITKRTGSFATAVEDLPKDVRGLDIMDQDWSIVQVKHNITEPSNNVDLGMFVDAGVTISMNNDNKIQNDWYLLLNGKIDLVGRSQLVQTYYSDLDIASGGFIERDQKGQSNKFNYNYWTSPVGTMSTTANNTAYTLNGVMRDGTNPASIQPINWVAGYNGSPTSPVSLSNYWIFKFQNLTPQYANWTSVGPNGTLLAGQGFTLKGSGAATSSQNYTFVGKPNNGQITSPIAAGNANLSGNPYPSAIDANKFITDNSSSITGTLYFWEHFPTNSSHNLIDYQGGYAARNLTGGIPPVSPSGVSGLGSSSRVPGRHIPVGQGFLVYGSATGGNIVFDNSQRTFVKEDGATSNPMFRSPSGPVATYDNSDDPVESDNFERVRIGFNSNGFHRQLLLGFMDGLATPGFDEGYDALNIDAQPNDMSFLFESNKMLIQGDGEFNRDNIYPLFIKTAVEGEVNITLDGTENFDENQEIYIYDNVTNTYNDIREEAYHVSLTIANIADRFSLRFKNPSLLSTSNPAVSEEVSILFTNGDNMLNITNKPDGIDIISVDLFNMLGQTIESWDVKDKDQDKIQIPIRNVSTGTYIVKVHTSKGDISKKIIIK